MPRLRHAGRYPSVGCRIAPAGDCPLFPPLPAHEEYGILEGVIQPVPDSPLVNQVYIPVICPVCKTRMLATPEQVGQELVCPDCQTRCPVPPPAERPAAAEEAPKARQGPDAEYGLVAGVDQPPPGSEAYAEHVAVECPVCHTRLHFTLDQVGQTAVCPDCLVPLVVPRPKPKPPAYVEFEQGPVDYDVAGKGDSPHLCRRRLLIGPRKPSGGIWSLPPTARRCRPIHSLTGVLRFPFYPGVWPRWLMFSLTALPIAALGLFAAELAMQGYGGLVAVFLLAATGFLATLWIAALGSELPGDCQRDGIRKRSHRAVAGNDFHRLDLRRGVCGQQPGPGRGAGAGIAWLDPP